MFRSLHAQLIGIVVTTVTVVLAVSQAVDSHLTVRAVEQDLKQRAELVLHAVDSLWSDSPPAELRDALAGMMRGDREITAIDVFRLHGAAADVEVSTRPLAERADAALSPDEVGQLERHAALVHALPPHDGATGWRLSIPLSRDGRVQGAARVDVRSTDAARLVARIRRIDAVVLLCSIAVISVILTVFLNRRVARPVGDLVAGMRRVERGDLAARVAPRPAGEFRFLGERFNAMVGRLQALTGHLGEQVRRATADLAQRNDQLQAANERLWQTQLELGRGERLAALGQMAGTLAHELGTPLNSVLGYVQLLRREPLGADQLDKLGIVESQLRRMIDEIRGVLGRTRDVPLRRTPVAVAALVGDALTLISARLTARDVRAQTELPADLPTVPADALGLRQV
ncbi:MAG: sensor histidine kinase, partial [Candidatus Binatia bacterium]